MKKITIALFIVMLLVFLAACAPDYTEEYNAVLDKYDAGIEKYNTAVDAYQTALNDDTKDLDTVVAEIEKVKAVDEEVLSNTKAYLDEIKGYEKGISDKESYEKTVSHMEDYIDLLESQLASFPKRLEAYRLANEYHDLHDEWHAELTAKADVLNKTSDVESSNAMIDEMIALNNDFAEQVQAIITQVEVAGDEELEFYMTDAVALMERAITTIGVMNDDLENMRQ
ncbi:MAG: hypothetical protein AB1Z19_08050 [Eubacteriales bacterium]